MTRPVSDDELRAALGSAPCCASVGPGGGSDVELWPYDRIRAAVESLAPQVWGPAPLGRDQLREELAYLLAERQHGTGYADFVATAGGPDWDGLVSTVDAMLSGPLSPYLTTPTGADPLVTEVRSVEVECHIGRDILASLYDAAEKLPICSLYSVVTGAVQEIEALRSGAAMLQSPRAADAPTFPIDASLREKLLLTMDYHLGKGRGRDMVVDNVLDRLEQELGQPGLRNAAKIASGVSDLFRLLHLERLVREWCVGKITPDVLDGLVHVLQQRLARARNVLTGFMSYDDYPSRRPASGEAGPGARTAVEITRDRAEGQLGTLKTIVRERVAEERTVEAPEPLTNPDAPTQFDWIDGGEGPPDLPSAVATEVMRLPFTAGGTEDEHGDRYGAVQEAVLRVLARPEFSLPPPPATGTRDRAEVIADCRERALRFWQEIDELCGASK